VVRGIDVSCYQGAVNWAAVKNSGLVQFVYAKATEGETEVDPEFSRNRAVCAERGIPFGAYHFFHPEEGPEEQAEHFLRAIAWDGHGVRLMPMVDVEIDSGKSASEISAALRVFLNATVQQSKRILIYSDYGFWNDNMNGTSEFGSYPGWIAEYNSDTEPTLPRGWSSWTIWQYSQNGSVPGIVGDVDLDMLNPRLTLSAISL
jgi:lysozyme